MGKKVLKWINHIVTGILVVVFIVFAAFVLLNKFSGGEPSIFGYQLKTVLSGSMEPAIKTGSIIAVKPGGDMTRFKEGDIITFMDEERRLVTHRIIEVVQSGDQTMYRTKGDNNNAPDQNLVMSGNVVAEYTGFTIPYLGYISEFVQSKNGILVTVILPGVLLLIYAIYTIWTAFRQLDKQMTTKSDQSADSIVPKKK